MSAKPLSVRELRKTYLAKGKMFTAVDGISFEIAPGECFGLLGPNGAGKSTSINCLIGFYPPTEGQVLVHGLDVYREPKAARQHLGVCLQEDTLDTDFDVEDQLIQHASFFRIPKDESKKRAQELLEKFDLAGQSGDLVETLSGGMRRKLQVARALMSNPSLLILDEPTTGLDPEARRTLWDVLLDCRKRGLAVLLCTHYMDEAERLCDRIAIMDHGKFLDVNTPRDLITKHVASEYVEEEIRPGVNWRRPANLEDVFLRLTGRKLAGVAL